MIGHVGHHLPIFAICQIFVGGAPVGEGLIDLLHQKAPAVKFREGYGMTESAGALTFGRANQAVPGSCGQLGT